MVDIDEGDHFGFLWRIVPDISFNGSTANNPSATISVVPRRNPGVGYDLTQGQLVTSAQDFSGTRNYTVELFTEYVYARARGRSMALRVESNTLGTQWQLGTPRLDFRLDGRKS
jgi:hypothetical protein